MDGLRRPLQEVSAQVDARREAPREADFNQRPTVNTTPSPRPMTSGKYIS